MDLILLVVAGGLVALLFYKGRPIQVDRNDLVPPRAPASRDSRPPGTGV